MDPIIIITMAAAGLKFAQEAIPAIQSMFAKGEISEADQARVRAEYDSLRQQAGGQYTGPEWELSGR